MSAVRRWTCPMRTPASIGRSLRRSGVMLPWVVMPRVLQLVGVRREGPRPRARAGGHEAAERRRLRDEGEIAERLAAELAGAPPGEEAAAEGVAGADGVDDRHGRRRHGDLGLRGD